MPIKRSRNLTLHADAHYIPKENTIKTLDRDAHFISDEAQVVGVADGIGDYARELIRNAAHIVWRRNPTDVRPLRVLEESYSKTESPGSSTACVVSLAGNILRAANIGDSGFMVIRGGKVVFRSRAQHHSFNFPYRMGRWRSGAEAAEEYTVAVEAGDAVVVGTDGLFDNVFAEDIAVTVGVCLERRILPDDVARVLAKGARWNAMDKRVATPCRVAAREAGVGECVGRTHDDITVVVAYVVTMVELLAGPLELKA